MDKDLFYIYKIKQGDITVFSELIEKYKDMAYNIAFQITRNREDAEEVAQDSFVKVYKSLNDFKAESKFSTWLYSIVYRTAISKTRKKRIETVDIESQYQSFDNIQDELGSLKQEEQERYIQLALSYLSAEDRSIVTLYYLESKSINEIAQITGITESNIKIKLYRSRKLMYSKLESVFKEDIKSIL
jgi:RNA polymerase sigma-70 factor (ECF subfamily)